MLDLSAAFDTIEHNCLFYKLRNYFVITGHALKWLQSYLTNGSSEVVIDNVHSSKTSNIGFKRLHCHKFMTKN